MPEPVYVFVVKGDRPVVLHPFEPSNPVFDDPSALALRGRYGTGESPGDADSLRSMLYAEMEKGARRHFVDKGFYARLFLTAGVFLAVYLFLSIVVRDPVPLVDELLLGGLAATAVYLVGERRAVASPRHGASVLQLRRSLDTAFFAESRVVDLVEAWRDESLSLGPAAFYRNGRETGDVTLSPDEAEEARALCAYLSRRWKSQPVLAELYAATVKGIPPGRLLDRALRRLGTEDMALAIAYFRLLGLVSRETGA